MVQFYHCTGLYYVAAKKWPQWDDMTICPVIAKWFLFKIFLFLKTWHSRFDLIRSYFSVSHVRWRVRGSCDDQQQTRLWPGLGRRGCGSSLQDARLRLWGGHDRFSLRRGDDLVHHDRREVCWWRGDHPGLPTLAAGQLLPWSGSGGRLSGQADDGWGRSDVSLSVGLHFTLYTIQRVLHQECHHLCTCKLFTQSKD